jgi:chaperonin GroEL
LPLATSVVPGGGVALVRAISALNKLKGDNHDQDIGIDIVKSGIKHHNPVSGDRH